MRSEHNYGALDEQGKPTIDKLRSKAEKKLGDDFDVREFHEAILENGAVPLPMLEEIIKGWIDEQSVIAEVDEAA